MSPGSLHDYGIRDGDVLLLQRVQGARGQPAAGRQMPPLASKQLTIKSVLRDLVQLFML